MKRAYRRKLLNKAFLIAQNRFAPPERLDYTQAMSLVRGLRRVGRYPQGQYVLEQICEQISTVPEPHLYLLNVYLDSMLIDKAKVQLELVSKKFPRDNDVMTNCARFYQLTNNLPEALAVLERATALHPDSDSNFVMRGLVMLAGGETSSALKSFDAALLRNPRNVAALVGKARALDRPARSQLVEPVVNLLAQPTLKQLESAQLYFLLADLFEHEDVKQQFHHLHKANDLVKGFRPYNAAQDAALTDNVIRQFSRETIALCAPLSEQRMSPVIVAAMPRAGTTLLEQMLGAHSRLESIGESLAFRIALQSVAEQGASFPGAADRAGEWIAAIARRFEANYFVKATHGARLIDKSIDNYMNLGSILLVYPNARVIDLQRHPLDIIYSCYRQDFAAGHNYAFDLQSLAEKYRLYHRMMDYWREVFPDQILSVAYEELVEQPERVLRQILQFCRLDWEEGCLDFRRGGAVVNTASAEQVRRPLYKSSIYKWQAVADHLKPAMDCLGDLVDYRPRSVLHNTGGIHMA